MRCLVLACVAWAAGFANGWQVREWKAGWAEARASRAVVRSVTRSTDISDRAGTRHHVRTERLRTVYRDLIREVPSHVPHEAARACAVPSGLVGLLDSAAQGVPAVSPPAGESDGSAASVGLDRIAVSVIDNYGVCNETRAELTALQAWVRAQAGAGPSLWEIASPDALVSAPSVGAGGSGAAGQD